MPQAHGRLVGMRLIILLAAFAGGCAAPVTDTDGEDTCNRSGWLSLLGANIAAVSLPASPDVRAFGEGDPVTQDYVPTRANIVYDESGTIIRVYCG